MAMIRFQIAPAVRRANGVTIDTGYAWRFLAGNNRDEARGPQLYPSVTDTETGITGLKARLDEIHIETRPGPGNTWEWRALIGSDTVALGTRHYARMRRARDVGEAFLATARRAAISVTDPDKWCTPMAVRA